MTPLTECRADTPILHLGDVFQVMASIPDHSIELILCSPPFLDVRNYLPEDDENKHLEIGTKELNPAQFLATLLDLTTEFGRILSPYGSIGIELGDKYTGSSHTTSSTKKDWPLEKSWCTIPEAYRFALTWGINPFTGEPTQTGKWRVRNVIRWCKPTPPSGSLSDKWRPATTDMVIACRSNDRYFDKHAIIRPYSVKTHPRVPTKSQGRPNTGKTSDDTNFSTKPIINNSGAGAPPKDYVDTIERVLAHTMKEHTRRGLDQSATELSRSLRKAGLLDWGDAWEIQSKAYPGAHHATWAPELLEDPIKALCPPQVCDTCNQPRRRVVTETSTDQSRRTRDATRDLSQQGLSSTGHQPNEVPTVKPTQNWTNCGCNTSVRAGRVLDPFAGSGTTLAVAHGHNRTAIGIDLDPRNADLCRARLGMFLTVSEHPTLHNPRV